MWTKENNKPEKSKGEGKSDNNDATTSLYYFIGILLHSIFNWVQQKWVAKMKQLTDGLSKKYLIGYWFLFSAAFAGILTIQIGKGFNYSAENSVSGLGVPNLHLPEKVLVKESKSQLNYNVEASKRIMKFSTYLDSLKNDSEQTTLYDSIKLCRSGLLDSLLFIENNYQLNFKKQEYGNKTTFD